MKQLLVCLIVVLGIACKTSESPRPSDTRAVVAKADGLSEFLPGGQSGAWKALAVGHVLNEGDQVRTAAEGQVDLRLDPHGGVMSVMPNSTLQIEQLGPRGAGMTNQQTVAVIRLTRGRVVGDTLKLPQGSKVVIKTNAGTFAIP